LFLAVDQLYHTELMPERSGSIASTRY